MEIKRWLGLKNTTSSERLKPGQLEVASNVDIDDTGRLVTSLAPELVRSGAYHSLWADGDQCLVMSGTDMYRVNTDYTLTFLTRLTSSRRVSYNRQQGVVYFSNGVDRGRLHAGGVGSWGIVPPVGQPAAAATGGSLPAGTYQYALTFRRADGQESGTGLAGRVELSSQGGIAFSSIEVSADAEVADKVIYISGPNGTELYRALVLQPSATSASFTATPRSLGIPLVTQFDNPPPPGDIVESYNGVMYVVRGNTAWHSKPYAFERFCFKDQWQLFPGPVAVFGAVNDGIYVATDEATWFLSGKGPGDFQSKQVLDYGAIPGTAAKAVLGDIKALEESKEGAEGDMALYWSTPRGVVLGTDGGTVLNVTERDFSIPGARRGAGIVRQAEGYTQYLAALESAGSASNVAR